MVKIQKSHALWHNVGSDMGIVMEVGDTVSYAGYQVQPFPFAVNDEMGNSRRVGSGVGGTINEESIVLVIMSVGCGQCTTQIIPWFKGNLSVSSVKSRI